MATSNHIPESSQLLYREMVALGGGKFRGIFEAAEFHFEPIVLFDNPKTDITLGIRVSKMSAERVRRVIAESEELHELRGPNH